MVIFEIIDYSSLMNNKLELTENLSYEVFNANSSY